MTRAARLLAITLTAALTATGCATATTPAGGPRTPTAPTPVAGGPTQTRPASPTRLTRRTALATRRGGSPRAVAEAFAAAYAEYLDAALAPAALPDAGQRIRAQAGPVISPRERAGVLAVQAVRRLPGGTTFAIELRDLAHAFPVRVTLARDGTGWQAIDLVAPDLDSILAPPTPPIPQLTGSQAAAHAARRFLHGYLAWLYGTEPVGAIEDATPALSRWLGTHRPRIPPTFQRLRGRLAALGMRRQDRGWHALANVTDGRETYDLTLSLEQLSGQWAVSSVGSPG